MTPRRTLAACLCIVAACSSGSGDATTTTFPPAPAVTADPCSLLSDEAVGSLSDDIERPGTSDEVAGEHTCAWRNINGVAVVSLRVSAVGSSTVDEELGRIGLAGDRYVPVDGVGDEAIAVFRGRSSAGQGERLHAVVARSGTDAVVLTLDGLDIRSEDEIGYVAAADLAGQAISAV